jgi:hypothetical protein
MPTAADRPPADASEWSDDQWLSWLRATDDPADHEPPTKPSPIRRLQSSAGGRIIGSAMLGLAAALGKEEEPTFVERKAAGDPSEDDDLQVHLDPDHPERSTAILRRHKPR